METRQDVGRSLSQLGEKWIRALLEKDFQRLGEICSPDVHSRLMTPKQVYALDNSSDLRKQVENWFHECTSIQLEQSRIEMVGRKLAISYRFHLVKDEMPHIVEQQLYCSLNDGLIGNVNLLCSGFQPVQIPVDAPAVKKSMKERTLQQKITPSVPQAHALLEFEPSGRQGSTCALLTPSIKRKLGEMSSGQVLEVHVDDPDAKGDIEAWCRLSGNPLIKMDQDAGRALRFYLMKK